MGDDVSLNARRRRERFVRVATRRTQKVLNSIRTLGNCANRSAYQYDSADVQKIFDAVERELTRARARFDAKDERKGVQFSIE